jgi:hypothetical protein
MADSIAAVQMCDPAATTQSKLRDRRNDGQWHFHYRVHNMLPLVNCPTLKSHCLHFFCSTMQTAKNILLLLFNNTVTKLPLNVFLYGNKPQKKSLTLYRLVNTTGDQLTYRLQKSNQHNFKGGLFTNVLVIKIIHRVIVQCIQPASKITPHDSHVAGVSTPLPVINYCPILVTFFLIIANN